MKRPSKRLRTLAANAGIQTDGRTTLQQLRDAWGSSERGPFTDQHDVAFEQCLNREYPQARPEGALVTFAVPAWALEDLVHGIRGRAYWHEKQGRAAMATSLNVIANQIAGEVK